MADDWPATLKSQWVTAGEDAASVALLANTKHLIVVNFTANGFWINLNGTATAGSGSYYVPATSTFERSFPAGSGSTLSHIRAGASDAQFELTEIG